MLSSVPSLRMVIQRTENSMLKLYIISMFAVILVGTASATDKGSLVFNDTIHDFGEIAMQSGRNTCRFDFVNTSDSTICILGALASCSCTTVDYPHEAIEPGQTGTVRVTYDTVGRPAGPFDRTVLLILSGDRPPARLRFCGTATTSSPSKEQFF